MLFGISCGGNGAVPVRGGSAAVDQDRHMFVDNASDGQRGDMSPFRFQSVRSRHFSQALPTADRSRDRPWRRPEHRLRECVRAGVNIADHRLAPKSNANERTKF